MNRAARPFHVMAKPVGAACNLACRYCYYLSKERLYPGSTLRMSDEGLEEFIRQYIEAQPVLEISFVWQGGEPTLAGLDFYRQAVTLQQKYRKPGMQIQNAIQTNATLIDENWCRFFKENDFLVGVSLDGPQDLHDRYRVDRGGQGTFRRVMAGVELLQRFQVDFNILTTVHAANAGSPLEVYRFLRDDMQAQFIQFIPIVERQNESGFQEGYRVTRRSVSGKQYGRFLSTVFDEWVQQDVGQVFIQLFDVALAAWVGQPGGLCIFSETCGTAMVLEHNMDLYACDHFVEPDYLLGNLEKTALAEMAFSDGQIRFGNAKRDLLPLYCRDCEVLFVCHGGCLKNRIRKTPDGEEGLNILCEGYRAFFNHIRKPMESMAARLQISST